MVKIGSVIRMLRLEAATLPTLVQEMNKLMVALLIASVGSACSMGKDDSADKQRAAFDAFCWGFEELIKQPNYDSMDSEQRHDALLARVNPIVEPETHAYIAWDAIRFATAHERYQLFTEAAASTGFSGWECEAMKLHADEVGRPSE